MTPIELKALRTSAGLTQREAARLVGVHPRTLQNWEWGNSRIPVAAAEFLKAKIGDKQ